MGRGRLGSGGKARRHQLGEAVAADGLALHDLADAPGVGLFFDNVGVEAFWSIVDSHLRWTYISNRIVGLEMAKRGAGSIVNLASVLAYRPSAVTGYSEGKTAIVNLTQSLAVEWARKGVRVNAVAPGWTDTPFLKARPQGRDFSAITDAVPQGRLIQAAEIAEVIHFLLSPASSAITGTTIPCDAGYIAGTGWAPAGGLPKGN